jgi:type IV pilus assembly protein PilM
VEAIERPANQARKGRLTIARPFSAAWKWTKESSAVGTTEVRTHLSSATEIQKDCHSERVRWESAFVMANRLAASDKPRIACELTAERVIAARAADSGAVDAVSARAIPAGSLTPGLDASNVANADAIREAISDALSAVGARSHDLIVILPDAAIRIVLLDFEEFPERRQDADPVVRFRLKKSLPFDTDQAALSYEFRRTNGNVRVIAAVTPPTLLAEYESLFRDAGYSPGVVLPSMLAALGAVDPEGPTLVLKVDVTTTTVAIVQPTDVLLYRTLENPHGNRLDAAALADDIYPSLVFFQDNYGVKVERILLGGLASAQEIGAALEAQTGARVADLISASQVGPQGNLAPTLFAGVVGALLP